MKFKTAVALIAAIAIVLTIPVLASATDEQFKLRLKTGESVAFTGISARLNDEEKLILDLDWTGLAIAMDIMGVNTRLGMAFDFWTVDQTPADFGFTGGLGLDWTQIINLLAVVETSGNAFVQKTSKGVSGALTARVAANTAKMAIELDAGAMWPDFDKFPAKMLGQSAWSRKADSMDEGQGWLELAFSFLTAKNRKDSIRLSYSRDIEEKLNRFDIGYGTSFRPEGTGFTIGLNTGIGFGQIVPILSSEFFAQYDITDQIGLMAAIGAQGGLSPMAWIRGKAWAEINEAVLLELEGKTPIIVLDPTASKLYLEDLTSRISLGITFPKALMSKVEISYDFNKDTFGLGYSMKF